MTIECQLTDIKGNEEKMGRKKKTIKNNIKYDFKDLVHIDQLFILIFNNPASLVPLEISSSVSEQLKKAVKNSYG